MRLPSVLATFGTAWIVARLARRWWGPIEALFFDQHLGRITKAGSKKILVVGAGSAVDS